MAESFNVTEPLTKRLSGLLKEYPPGVSILRELLQNADDAGATSISYTIDTHSYATNTLVDEGLAEFQGPALLVSNNSIFTEKDFQSLQRLGDSQKLQDKIATGKFGLGFSSVYGWTDSPQILTGEYFVALSPHHRLHTKNGDNGLRFNFVEQVPYPTDQIEPFGMGTRDVMGKFDGTIIRIPLRTEEQSKTSEIIALVVTPDDILTEFKAFQSEVADSLLYLKNIEKIEFKLDHLPLGGAEIINIADIGATRLQINNAITNARTGSFAFQLKISHSYNHGAHQITSMRSFHLQHRFADITADASSRDLAQWAAEESFFPWIALAAPLIPWSSSEKQSRIFVTLPLPIFMKDNLVNIHGMFALSRDRRSLWTPMDAQGAGKATKEIQWNTYLYKAVIPAAWEELLVALAKLGQPIYEYLPIVTPRPSALDETLAADVLRLVINDNCPIWYSTTNKMLSLTDGYLPLKEVPTALLNALQSFSMPIFDKIPEWIKTLIRQGSYSHRPLKAGNVRHWLRQQFKAGFGTNPSSAIELLRYILIDKNYSNLHSLPLFLCKDAKLRSLTNHAYSSIKSFEDGIYVATEEEFQLFGGNGSQFLDESVCEISQIKNDLNAIRKSVNLGSFSLNSFRLYARKGGFEAQDNQVEIDGVADFAWIQRLWKWLDKHSAPEVRTAVEGLCLIPLQSSSKLHLVHSWIPKMLLIPHATGGALIMKIHEKAGKSFPLVDGRFHVTAKGFLRSTRRIADTTDIQTIFLWITPEIVAKLPDSTRDEFRKYIVTRCTNDLSEIDQVRLSKLPIYKSLLIQENLSFKHSYIALLPGSSPFIPVRDLSVAPILDGVHLIDVSDNETETLLKKLSYPTLSDNDFIEQYVIANLASQPSWLIDSLMEYIFKHVSVSATWYKRLGSVPFVVVRRSDGTPSTNRLRPTQVIDESAAIAELYFDDEEVFAAGMYEKTHILQLKLLGMKTGLDTEVVDDRIRKYVTPRDGLRAKCESLLQFLSDHGSSVTFNPEWTSLIRMPAVSLAGKKVVLPASECRPKSLKPLVDGVLAIVSTHVKESLYDNLGWNKTLEPVVLGMRINVIANKQKESSSVERSLRILFDYVKSRVGEGLEDYVEKMKSKISVTEYLPGSIAGLWSPNDVYLQNARDFEPYLSNIPLSYSRSCEDILTLLGVRDQPSSESLLCVLSKLPIDQPLNDTDLNVAINILRHFAALPAADTTQLLAPSIDGRLYGISEFNSPKTSKHLFAHPKVPAAVAFKFNIPQVGDDTAFNHHLNQADILDDYCQEELITTRIANTLKEYSLSTSFNEFIANAEDCGSATKVTWSLDSEDSLFPTDSLFSKELSSWQTPSLYVYNDGVFSENDFKAFINTGGGSKADDPTKIGKYGLGSLTMYHFTDIPSLISGEYFVIFDPSRKYLPLSNGRTRAGLRVPLSMMKAKFKDHLVPFIGIGGYSLDLPKFDGTIFRFPLRSSSQHQSSLLVSKVEPFTHKQLQNQLDHDYYLQAKRSLVLLRNLKKIEFQLGQCDATDDQSSEENDRRFRGQWKVVSKLEQTVTIDPTAQESLLQKIEVSTVVVGSNRCYPKLSIQKAEWLVVTGFLSDECLGTESAVRTMAITEGLLSPQGSRKAESIPDVGVAVQLSPNVSDLSNSFYSSLPLPAPTGLPISCHGHFAISSDRRSIRIDGASGDWNEFLGKSCLPHLYFVLLEYLCSRNEKQYYSYWPSSTPAENAIIHTLQSSFWQNVRYTSRKIILGQTHTPFSMSQTIFDGRIFSLDSEREGPVVKLVRILRPFSCVLYEPRLNNGLLDRLDGDQTRDGDDINVLNPSFVREVLRESLAQSVLPTLDDLELKDILRFALDNGPLERLIGCYIWRLANGSIIKLEPVPRKVAYVVEEEGFDLFEKCGKDVLVRAAAICPEVLDKWTLEDKFNIRRLDGPTIDGFMSSELPLHPIMFFKKDESERLGSVWRYVLRNKMTVTFYQTRPSLSLKDEASKFVSLHGLDSLPIMGWDTSLQLSEVCSKLKISVLSESTLEPVKKICGTWHHGERFLECVYRLAKNYQQVRNALDGLDDDDVRTIRKLCMNLSDRLSSRPSSDHMLSILRYLPIWTSVLNVTKQGQQRLHSVAAIDALLITDTDFFFPDLTPPHANCQFVAEVPTVQKLIERLGGRKLTTGDYAIKYVCPCLPHHPRDDQLLAISKFLGHLADVCENNPRVLKENVLIADRMGRLRFGRDLYINGNKIFDAAFEGEDDAFPHSLFQKLPLRQFGVETSVTKASFIRCARNLEKQCRANEVEQRAALWTRCEIVWSHFNELLPSEDGWLLGDLGELAKIQFVPVLRNTTRPTYRDDHMRQLIDSNVVSTMTEVLSPAFIPIAWTQRVFANTPPAPFLHYIGFAPTIGDVVEHLVELSTTFAAKCTMKEEKFFDDLAKTYDYLNQQVHVLPASVYLLQRHLGKKVWLNEDLSLCDVSKFRKLGVPTDAPISSLTWLSAKSILHGVPYDLPTYDLYSAKSSLEPYRNILRECGSEVVENVKVVTSAESIENHGNYMLGLIRDMMTKQGSVYDMKIAIQGQEFFAHRVLLGAVSTYFCRLCYGDWKEKSTGELDLDAETYGTAGSVGSVIEWVYNGYLKLDDGLLPEDEVTSRLDHYLDILELSNVWDIVALRAHVENRILKYADKFIRVENVSNVMGTAGRYNAKVLKEFCEDFISKNKRVVAFVEGSPEPE